MDSFPIDNYTPYGYLNLPGHTRRVNPKGVMRSDGVGFSWHFPALATSYGGRRETYRAGLRLTGMPAPEAHVPYHSSNQMTFETSVGRSTWFMINDDCLAVVLEDAQGIPIELMAHYERVISADGEWGESGLVGRVDRDLLILQAFEDGDAFALRALGGWVDFGRVQWPLTQLADHGELAALTIDLTVVPTAERCWVLLGRGRTADAAISQVLEAAAEQAFVTRQAADEEFWQQAPRLIGDWPEHWRRGVVYDLETLRMMIKQPVGRYQYPWDAMQIQAPRTVLAETAMDALALSWADPAAAAEMFLGTLRNAPLPNIPCSREDGSYNMVSADGAVCGTGPQWGYPFVVAERIAAAHPDADWVCEIYPPLAGYLNWWLENRRDDAGYLVHACSWESGQDLSPRFGDQPLGGGHPTWQIRPVDLQAAAAHAAKVLARFAAIAAPDEAGRWMKLSGELAERTGSLWLGDRYGDWDATDGRPTEVVDVMQLVPLTLGLADQQMAMRLVATLEKIRSDDLVWPMFVWTHVLACLQAGKDQLAGDMAGAVIDRAYRFWDARTYDDSTTLPGIASEYWPMHGRRGGEGYGWGAFTTELLLNTIVGIDIRPDAVVVRPRLPAQLAVPGTRLGLQLTIWGRRAELVLEPQGDGPAKIVWDGRSFAPADGCGIRISRDAR